MDRTDRTMSFRDPAGRVLVLDDQVLRWVHDSGRAALDAYLASATIRQAIQDGRAIDADPLPPDTDAGHHVAEDTLLVRHRRIAFPSYPYEWAPEMLQAAAELTLDLQAGLSAEDRGLKDATPYNILFEGPRPVFIDALSVEDRDPHDPVWTPYGQFIRTFLLPLLVQRDLGVPLGTTLLTNRDGLQPDAVHRMTPRLRRLRAPYRSLVTLPTWLAGRAERQGEALYTKRRMKDARQARFTVESAVRSLRKELARVAPPAAATSNWAEYMATRDHYDDTDAQTKDTFVAEALARVRPERVLDVGCNTGHFSAMAAQAGSDVVAIDLDPVSVGRLWRRAVAEGLPILPLVVDLSRPTPAVGWRNRECPSFLERAEGRFDLVLFLAVMHHLHVTERIPIDEIVRMAHRLTQEHVIIEYVGPQDPMFRRLVRGRGELYQDLSRESFEKALAGRFGIVEARPLAGTDRVLYLLERQGGVTEPALEEEMQTV